MPNYFYTAKSLEGETKTGIMKASDEHDLAKSLKEDGLILIKVNTKETRKKPFFNLSFLIISQSEKIILVKNLGIMFATGLSLVKSFDILATQAKSKKLKDILLDIKENINKGENLSSVLGKYPNIFSDFFINMIKVGEESGTLEEVLQILSLHLSKEHELKSRIRNAMIYPSIILLVMMFVGAVIVLFVLPSLSLYFSSLNVNIPLSTKVVLFLGEFFSKYWYLLFLSPFFLVFLVFLVLKTDSARKSLDGIFLKVPLISPIVKKNNSAFFVRSLSSLIAAGISLNRALEIISKTMGNYYFKKAILQARKEISR